MAGAPKGNNNAANAHFAKQALIKALEVRAGYRSANAILERFRTLVEIWDKQINQALEGDNASAQMIVERMDGKAKQVVDVPEDSKGEAAAWVLMPVRVNAENTDR